MKKVILALSIAASLAGCGKPDEKAAPPPPRVENGAVVFDRASPQLAQLRSALSEPLRESVVRLSGRLIWNEDRTARIFTPFAGKVLAIHVKPGDRVKQGQALADFAAPDLGVAQ